MNPWNEVTLRRLLREALPPPLPGAPSHDLWARLLAPSRPVPPRLWLDLGVAAAVAVGLALAPNVLWLLLYHL
jgi:hypothetical protein